MGDEKLYIFWTLVTALFVFAMVYAWFIAIIVRKSLPGELAWTFLGMALITGSNAFVRSGQTVVDPEHVQVFVRAMFMMAAISACVSVVMLGIQYNWAVSEHMPLRKQVRLITRAFGYTGQAGAGERQQ